MTCASPTQNGGSVQVLSVRLQQDFRWRALNWCNTVTYQKSSDESVLPLPQLAIYSNLFLRFKLAKVLDVQMGVDLDYYTRYYAPAYQPATMTFHNQSQIKCGNYPYMNAYVNMQLSRARFFVLFSHVNQGVFGGSDYFSIPTTRSTRAVSSWAYRSTSSTKSNLPLRVLYII